jgi:tetratricopeptide (TPR) repeat protein
VTQSRSDRIHEARSRKEWDRVESYAREWLASEPNSIYVIQLIGEALEKQGRVREALKCYEAALRIDSEERCKIGHTFFLKRLDVLYHRDGEYQDCLRVCQYYTSRHPESWDAWNRLRRATEKTGHRQLSAYARARAEGIKRGKDEAKHLRDLRQQRFGALYEESLRQLGYEPHPSQDSEITAPNVSLDPPSRDASADEWGNWAQQTTNWQRLDAEVQAMLSAGAQMERMEFEEQLGPPQKMTVGERYETILSALAEVDTGNVESVVLSDRLMLDICVQVTQEQCEVFLNAWDASSALPWDDRQHRSLISLGFNHSSDSVGSDYRMNRRDVSHGQLASALEDVFKALGSSPDFEIIALSPV